MTSIFASDIRYKVFTPNWARVEELGARGLTTMAVQAALRSGQVRNFGSHREYLLTTSTLNYNDKAVGDDPEDSTYKYDLSSLHNFL